MQYLESPCFENYNDEIETIQIDSSYWVTIGVKSTEEIDKWDHKWDESLVKEISLRPPLYNYRLPVKERTELKKIDLWKEIHNCLRVPCKMKTMKKR